MAGRGSARGEFWRGDVERRDVLRFGAFSATGYTLPALQWFTSDREVPRSTAGRRLVGHVDVDMIREVTSTLRQLDNQYGGGRIRATVARYLDSEVSPLLRDGRFDGETGRALLSAAAEANQLAGWMAYDTGEHAVAQQYLIHALDLARAGGDHPLGAEILAAMSHQATYLGDSSTAIDLARAAGRTADKAGVPVLVAEAAVMEAHGHARGGDSPACAASLSRAERALDRADRSRDPQWISYFDTAYMSAKFGHCFRELGASQAGRALRQAVTTNGQPIRPWPDVQSATTGDGIRSAERVRTGVRCRRPGAHADSSASVSTRGRIPSGTAGESHPALRDVGCPPIHRPDRSDDWTSN